MTPTPPSQHSLRKNIPPPAAALALLPFDAALFVVSNYLAEARLASDVQDFVGAQKLYAAAEACALKTGFVELMQLVWSDTQNLAPSKNFPPSRGAVSPLR